MHIKGNQLPPNSVRCTAEDALRWLVTNHWAKRLDYTQLLPGYIGCTIIHDGQGEGIAIKEPKGNLQGEVECYLFVMCEHKFDVAVIGKAQYRETCTKCGLIREIDSSD